MSERGYSTWVSDRLKQLGASVDGGGGYKDIAIPQKRLLTSQVAEISVLVSSLFLLFLCCFPAGPQDYQRPGHSETQPVFTHSPLFEEAKEEKDSEEEGEEDTVNRLGVDLVRGFSPRGRRSMTSVRSASMERMKQAGSSGYDPGDSSKLDPTSSKATTVPSTGNQVEQSSASASIGASIGFIHTQGGHERPKAEVFRGATSELRRALRQSHNRRPPVAHSTRLPPPEPALHEAIGKEQ